MPPSFKLLVPSKTESRAGRAGTVFAGASKAREEQRAAAQEQF